MKRENHDIFLLTWWMHERSTQSERAGRRELCVLGTEFCVLGAVASDKQATKHHQNQPCAPCCVRCHCTDGRGWERPDVIHEQLMFVIIVWGTGSWKAGKLENTLLCCCTMSYPLVANANAKKNVAISKTQFSMLCFFLENRDAYSRPRRQQSLAAMSPTGPFPVTSLDKLQSLPIFWR